MSADCFAVKIDRLPVGLELDCKVYVMKGGEFNFFCENTTVTEGLLTRFRNAAEPYDEVYMGADYLRAFLAKGIDLGWVDAKPQEEEKIVFEALPEPPQEQAPAPEPKKAKPKLPEKYHAEAVPIEKLREVKKHYDEAKVETKKIFKGIEETRKVDIPKAEDFIVDIGKKLECTDVSLLLQTLNSIRGVDEYLHTHSLNVAFLNGLMAKWLKYDKAKHADLIKIGLLHDIGKLVIPPEILNKPARLTPEEFNKIKQHSTYSFELLVNSGIKEKAILLGVMQHHEKLNGTGYPHGITTKDITDYARITAISDIYDAMVAKRVYKEAHSPFEILESFSKEGYSELDINYVKKFIDCMIDELKGKLVVLSDDSVAKVMMVNERNLIYPMVEVDGNVITTSPELHVVSMFNRDLSAEHVD
jgi:HD-GYP domain-containing protein (c-di-GMP phosphodiesterase class II)